MTFVLSLNSLSTLLVLSLSENNTRSSSREVGIRVPTFSAVYFSRGTLTKKGLGTSNIFSAWEVPAHGIAVPHATGRLPGPPPSRC